ncbi:rRNA pseudouridine synthase [Candidatus Woesearchaeota archaeon]|nr:rRNA pseudouridine synthase [Candidatus Woesearchaeota archaeon]
MRTQLHRALSKLGFCSRAQAVPLIKDGKIRINGIVATGPLVWVDMEKDKITIQGGIAKKEGDALKKPVSMALNASQKVYYAFHKPKGYVTTRDDEQGKQTIYDLFPAALKDQWLFAVGRLDKDSEGLLLLTNDGPWSQGLLDPDSHVEKEYLVWLDHELAEYDRKQLEKGIVLDGERTLPCVIRKKTDGWSIILQEGRNRQVRNMFAFFGYKVLRLVRVRIGMLELGRLEVGKVEKIRPELVIRK